MKSSSQPIPNRIKKRNRSEVRHHLNSPSDVRVDTRTVFLLGEGVSKYNDFFLSHKTTDNQSSPGITDLCRM